MPFTPFHLGAGAVFKAIGGRNVSFMVFGGAQVLMDIEPLIGLIQGNPVLHGYTHTIAGAMVIGCIAALSGKPISGFVLRLLQIPHYPLSWLAACSGAFLGTFSHIALDAIMHHDIEPWWPFALGNGLLGVVPLRTLHLALAGLAVAGGAVVGVRAIWHGRT